MSTVNIIKYYFHVEGLPKDPNYVRNLVRLAYQTATAKNLYPRAVFIRADVHSTTTINSIYQKDPKGDHITLCFKNEEHMRKGTHIACHGYVTDRNALNFREATDSPEKADSTKKKSNKKPVWPSSDKLQELPEGWYSHLDSK
ncbi:hypothetical protein VDGD_05248 [Verticillium dahliae]|nr:Eukaryotic translation initiation factor 4E-1 [Verticillium dahliae VDG1]RBQ82583.1 hypothetical protein VDGD_05248 [Verticillium dahliae]